jgi:hypothetical protein
VTSVAHLHPWREPASARGTTRGDERCLRVREASIVRRILVLAPFLAGFGAPLGASAQTDFYNLDKDRPLRVEDAFPSKQWAFEVKVSPLTLSQDREGVLSYTPGVELQYGLLPGVGVSAGVGARWDRMGDASRLEADGVELSTLANLWVEGERLPAAAIRVTGHLPTNSDDHSDLEVRGILTRTLGGPVRLHLNGAAVAGGGRAHDWWAGAALDYVLPFQHTILLVEGLLTGPALRGPDGSREIWSATGFRRQLSPTLVLDVGVGREWQGDPGRDWALTLGVTREFGVRALIPGGGR